MLSRDAEGIYWMSRYMERAGHVSRLIAEQLQSLHDRPFGSIERGWQRLFTALGRTPAGSALIPVDDDASEMLFDAFTLIDDLAFEPQNADALLTCLARARENARQVRNVISHEMWSCLNVAFLDMRDTRLQDIWTNQPQVFFSNASSVVTTFVGVADATMYRDHGWHFFRLGRFVERAVRTSSLLGAQIALFPTSEQHWVFDWGSLLRVCEARAAFRRVNSIEYPPADVVDFLVTDANLSNSICYTLNEVADAYDAIAGGRRDGPACDARRRIGRARAFIEYDWPTRDRADDDATRPMLQTITSACLQFHTDLEAAFFSYPVWDSIGEESP